MSTDMRFNNQVEEFAYSLVHSRFGYAMAVAIIIIAETSAPTPDYNSVVSGSMRITHAYSEG